MVSELLANVSIRSNDLVNFCFSFIFVLFLIVNTFANLITIDLAEYLRQKIKNKNKNKNMLVSASWFGGSPRGLNFVHKFHPCRIFLSLSLSLSLSQIAA
jgi:hypothetical protein